MKKIQFYAGGLVKNAKKAIIIVLCLTILCGALYKGYDLFLKKDSAYCDTPDKDFIENDQRSFVGQREGKYNFKRMLDLIEKTQWLKKLFYEQYTGAHGKRKTINVKTTKELLADLYREKIRLQKYIWEIKVRYKGQVPLKRKRTFQHYQQIIDQSIADIEKILRLA